MAGRVTIYRRPFQEDWRDSRALLLRAACLHTGLSAEELGPVHVNQWGKPALPGLECSVTHSGSWWLCACGDAPLGLDLQLHRAQADPEKLSRRFFHPREDGWLAQVGYERFFDVWCAKESWVKYTGRGFHQDPATFSVVDAQGRFPAMDGVEFRLLPFGPGYSLCLCAPTLDEVRFCDLPD